MSATLTSTVAAAACLGMMGGPLPGMMPPGGPGMMGGPPGGPMGGPPRGPPGAPGEIRALYVVYHG